MTLVNCCFSSNCSLKIIFAVWTDSRDRVFLYQTSKAYAIIIKKIDQQGLNHVVYYPNCTALLNVNTPFFGVLYNTANDPLTANDLQNGP